MPGSPASYEARAFPGTANPICLPPAGQGGIIDFGRVFISLGAHIDVFNVGLQIIKFDGTLRPGIPPVITVRRGRREVFELQGGNNPDALAVVDLRSATPSFEWVSVLVETDSP